MGFVVDCKCLIKPHIHNLLTQTAFGRPLQKRPISQSVTHFSPATSQTKSATPFKLPRPKDRFAMSPSKEWRFSLKKSASTKPQTKIHRREINSDVLLEKSSNPCNKVSETVSWTGVLVYYSPCTLARYNQAVSPYLPPSSLSNDFFQPRHLVAFTTS